MDRRIIGIDISDKTFDAGYVENEKRFHKQFANNLSGYRALLKWCAARRYEASFCMEATGAYSTELAEYLHGRGFVVFVENARLIKAFRESENERNSTDKTAAIGIARYASSKLSRLRRWKPLPIEIKTLRELTRLRDSLVVSRDQWTNRIKSKALGQFRHYAEKARADVVASIKVVDAEIKRHVNATPWLKKKVALLTSIKGIGLVTATVILSEVPWIDEFTDKRDLVAFAGLNPAIRQSGTSIHGRAMLSKKGSPRLRKALYMPAVVALRHNGRIKAFAAGLKERDKCPMVIIGAVMRKLLCLAFGVLRSNEPYRVHGDAVCGLRAA